MVAGAATRARAERLDQLTFSRFLVVLLVLAAHGVGGIYRAAIDVFPVSSVFNFAPSAVSYLFVLSGFVMSLVYHQPGTRFRVRDFWTSRFVRIYPLYLIAFLLVCLYYLEYMAHISAVKILANLFIVQAWIPSFAQSFNYPAWSLTAEVLFYALFPFLTAWSYRQPLRKLVWASLGFWAVSQTVHYVLWSRYWPAAESLLVYQPVFHLSSCLLGAVGGAWYVREGQKLRSAPRTTLAVLTMGLVMASICMFMGDLFPWFPRWLQPMQGLFAPFFLVTILAMALDRSRLSRWLSQPLPVLLGETSYALYILHVPVVWLLERGLHEASLPRPGHIQAAAALPLMLVVGLVAHQYVDLPLRRWLKRMMERVDLLIAVVDIGVIAASVTLAFVLRFGIGRQLAEFELAANLMFWLAVVVRTAVAAAFSVNGQAHVTGAYKRTVPRLVGAISVGTIVIATLMWAAFRMGWAPGFPRGVLLMDWVFTLLLVLASRFALRKRDAPDDRQGPAVDGRTPA